MTNAKHTMFSDRRKNTDRRCQDLSMPAGLDRRVSNRRSRHFQALPWWLQIDYATELVSEKLTGNSTPNDTDEQSHSNSSPVNEKSD